jgi:hypothetical protein
MGEDSGSKKLRVLRMKCPTCQLEVGDMKFCGRCGARLERVCARCRFSNPPQFAFCGECGQKLEESGEIKEAEPAGEGERKQVTVLFSDLSGYTAMSERLDPEEVREIMSRIFGEIAQVVTRSWPFLGSQRPTRTTRSGPYGLPGIFMIWLKP